MKDYFNLSTNEVLKADAEYEAVLKTRISRLNSFKSNVSGTLAQRVETCIDLTKAGHKTAEAVKSANHELSTTFPHDTNDAIERIINKQKKTREGLKAETKWQEALLNDAELQARVKVINEIAEQLLREAFSKNNTKNFSEFLQEKLNSNDLDAILQQRLGNYDDEMQKSNIEQVVVVLGMDYSSYLEIIRTCGLVIELALIFRGLFYMGIVDIEGGKLDEKVMFERIEDISKEGIGALGPIFAILNIMLTVYQALKDYQGVDLNSKVVEHAEFVEQYLTTYTAALEVWKEFGQALSIVVASFKEVTQKYQ